MRSTAKFYIFKLLEGMGFGFVATLYVPYLHEIGLTPAQVLLVNGVFWLAALSFELPTGLLADGRGRGFSVALGTGAIGAGAFAYFFAHGLWGAIVAEAMMALGHAALSGATNAWIADAPDKENDLSHVFGTSTIIRGTAMIIGVLGGTQIATAYGTQWCFVIWGGFMAANLVFVLIAMQNGTQEHPLKELDILKQAIEYLIKTPEMRFIVVLDMLSSFYMLINLFWAPLFLARFQEIGLGEIELGWLFSVMYVVIVVSGYLVRRFKPSRWLSHRGALALIVVWVGMAVNLFSFTHNLVVWILLILAYEIGWGAFGPLWGAYVHERVPSHFRATFESISSFMWSGAVVVMTVLPTVLLWGEKVSEAQTMAVWRWTGIAMIVATAVAWYFRPKKG